MKKFFVGEIYTNKTGLDYEIIGYANKGTKSRRIVRFIETGYETEVFTHSINTGEIKDYLHKSIYSVACLGMKNSNKHPLFKRWKSMIERCYYEKHTAYSNYGGRGVYVCDRWLNFSNYVEDISKKENYSKLIEQPNKWHVDKDILIKNNLCYSNETTIIVKAKENINEMNKKNKKIVLQYTKDGEFVAKYNSLQEASDKNGISKNNLSSACLGRRKTAKGYIWKYE